jgi:hypothetical protein
MLNKQQILYMYTFELITFDIVNFFVGMFKVILFSECRFSKQGLHIKFLFYCSAKRIRFAVKVLLSFRKATDEIPKPFIECFSYIAL